MEQVRVVHDPHLGIGDTSMDKGMDNDIDHLDESTIMRRQKLKKNLKERRRALVEERRKVKEKIRAIDRALQNLRVGKAVGGGSKDDNDTATIASMASTVGTALTMTTSRSSPNSRSSAADNHQHHNHHGNGTTGTGSPPTKEPIVVAQVVQNLQWTVAAPDRRHGLYSGTALSRKIPHGAGTMVFEDGQVYKGPFKYGVMQGANGSLTSSSSNGGGGAKYVGGFWLNLKHGHGEELDSAGNRHVGTFEKGLAHGFGERHNADGTLFFSGQWVDGKPLVALPILPMDGYGHGYGYGYYGDGMDDETEYGESDSNTAPPPTMATGQQQQQQQRCNIVSPTSTGLNRLLKAAEDHDDDHSFASSVESSDGEGISMYAM